MGMIVRHESPKRESCGLFDTGHFIGVLQLCSLLSALRFVLRGNR